MEIIYSILEMADSGFLGWMAFVCLAFAVIGIVLGTFVFIGEWLINKFGLQEKIIKFFEEPEEK